MRWHAVKPNQPTMVDRVCFVFYRFLFSWFVGFCFSAISITSSPSNLFGVRFNFIFLGRSFRLTGDFFPWICDWFKTVGCLGLIDFGLGLFSLDVQYSQ